MTNKSTSNSIERLINVKDSMRRTHLGIIMIIMMAGCGPKYEEHSLPDGMKMRINKSTRESEVLTPQGWVKINKPQNPTYSTYGCLVVGKNEEISNRNVPGSNYVIVDFPVARVACPSYDQGKHVGALKGMTKFFSLPEGEIQMLIESTTLKKGEEKYTLEEFKRTKKETSEMYKLGIE